MDSDNIDKETREAESTKTEKSKAIVEEGVNNLLGPLKEGEFPYKIRDCFKNAVDCQEFDGNIQSGMKKIIERYYIASREKYEKKFKDDMKIILDLSVNYSKEDLMKMLQEPIVVQGTVVITVPETDVTNTNTNVVSETDVTNTNVVPEKDVQGTDARSDVHKDTNNYPHLSYTPPEPPKPLTKEDVAKMKKGEKISEETFNKLDEADKTLFEKEAVNYDENKSPNPIEAGHTYIKRAGPTAPK